MPIKPHKGESQDDFMARCMHELSSADATPRPQDQKVAICMTAWRDKAIKMEMQPDDDETHSEWMDRCTTAGNDEDDCQEMWDECMGNGEASINNNSIIRKTHVTEGEGMDFVLSDATPDRLGDIIEQNWELNNFKRNPIALFNHNSNFSIGKWSNLRVNDGALQGRLQLAPEGTSERIDEIRRLVAAGILRAVSVGFRSLESKALDEKDRWGMGPQRFIKSELLETSLVSIPANPNAVAIAKSLKVSDDTMRLIFAKHGKRDQFVQRRGVTGKHADKSTANDRRGKMSSPIATRIKETEERIVRLKDELTVHLEKADDENPAEDFAAITEELTAKIDQQEKLRDSYKKAEQHIMATVEKQVPAKQEVTHFQGGGSSKLELSERPFAMPTRKIRPSDYLWRAVTCQFKSFVERNSGRNRSMTDIMVAEYGEDTTTKVALDYVTRGATTVATTTGTGWVDVLVQTMVGDLIEALTAVSIFPKVAAMGSTYAFDRNAGKIVLPARTGGNLGGGFVAEGAPIPVKQGAFTSITLTPKKLGVITTMTRQAAQYSTLALESILRDAILQDTAVAIDTIFMDNNAATAIRPQGVQNLGGAALGATAGGGIVGLIGDLKAMVADLTATTAGNIRKPVWIMNPGDVLTAELTQSAAGGFLPFRDELAAGRLLGYPVIQSTTGTSDTMYLIDAADFMTAVGAPMFDVSDQAVLHMEDTTPLQLASGTGPTVATPIRSLFQTDSSAIRLLWDMDWAYRRQNVSSWITGLTWN